MGTNTIYILHKQGANSHYVALDYLLKKNQYHLKYREFSVFTKFYKSAISLNFESFIWQFTNLAFLMCLAFTKNKKVVLAIAPFDPKIGFLLKLLNNHQVYYHTSWACWDKTFHPKKKNNSPAVLEKWRYFLEDKSEHIFCVNQKGKNQLLENYSIEERKISVVYHALNDAFSDTEIVQKKENSFIYYGRMVPQKGIEELLNFFAKNKEATLTLIGDGKQRKIIEEFAAVYKNITYKKMISDKQELKKELAQHQYLILNAKWEELFSLVIIESMSQGVIPISSDLTGPREIITEETGILFPEGDPGPTLSKVIKNKVYNQELATNAISVSKSYLAENIAERWSAILK